LFLAGFSILHAIPSPNYWRYRRKLVLTSSYFFTADSADFTFSLRILFFSFGSFGRFALYLLITTVKHLKKVFFSLWSYSFWESLLWVFFFFCTCVFSIKLYFLYSCMSIWLCKCLLVNVINILFCQYYRRRNL